MADYNKVQINKAISNVKGKEAEEERQKQEKVTTGKVVAKKKSLGKSLLGDFVSDDAGNIWDYLRKDVFVPYVKDLIHDGITNTVELVLFGEARGRSGSKSSGSKTSYTSYYKQPSKIRTTAGSKTVDIEDIILETRHEAEEVLERLSDLIEIYGSASVADLYDMVGLQCDYTSNKYGWTRMGFAAPRKVREGYLLDLPRPTYLD